MIRKGRLEVIAGAMFSLKTTTLILKLEKEIRRGKKVQIFTKDGRHTKSSLVTHSGLDKLKAIYIKDVNDIKIKDDTDIIGLDEIQFIGKTSDELRLFCRKYLLKGKDFIAAGLIQDFQGNPFCNTLALLTEADEFNLLTSVCKCGNDAIRNHRKVSSKELILEGADEYEPLCTLCFEQALKNEQQE